MRQIGQATTPDGVNTLNDDATTPDDITKSVNQIKVDQVVGQQVM
ncbi:hypothetical protein [Weissella cibaria]|nr:hypothetical protein [Weissella cibaria]